MTTLLATTGVAVISAVLIAASGPAQAAGRDAVSRGAYLVTAMACADCHMPLKIGAKGPEPDLARGLSGHPQEAVLPPAPLPQGPWIWGGAATNTAFWGPWGVSYASNLTPDKASGIGAWRSEDFVNTMRRGKHLGVGRPLLPPMPWQPFSQLNDADLQAVFAYLQSRPAVRNAVPAPVPPASSPR